MDVITSNPVVPLPSLFDLHHRGELVAKLAPEMPAKVMEQICRHLEVVAACVFPGAGKTSIESDILGLLNAPAIRAYVLEDWDHSGPTRWAAVAAAYLRQVKIVAPDLLGLYVDELVPCVAATISSVVRIFRLGPRSELRAALQDRSNRQLRLSLFGPLAMFFIESVAGGRVAWHVLVNAENAPKFSRTFGWAPTLDPLPLMMRLTLFGSISRFPKRKALLYSPLARYLIELGMLQRLNVIAKNTAPAGESKWLLSHEYAGQAQRDMRGAVVMNADAKSTQPWQAVEASVDLRTGRRILSPDELVELAEARERLLAAAKSLVGRYASRPQLKRLVLWAHVADVSVESLLGAPGSLNEDQLAALAGAAVQKKWRGQLEKLNAKLRELSAVSNGPENYPFTAGQSRTTLTRLRQEFRAELNTN